MGNPSAVKNWSRIFPNEWIHTDYMHIHMHRYIIIFTHMHTNVNIVVYVSYDLIIHNKLSFVPTNK